MATLAKWLMGFPAQVSAYLVDSFTDANNVALRNHAPDVGGPWTTSNAVDPFISGNRLRAAGTAWGVAPCAESFTATATLEFLAGASSYALRFWHIDASNYWLADVQPSGGIRLIRFVSGAATVPASAAIPPISAGTPFAVSLTVNGTAISFTAGGATISHTAVSPAKSSNVGVSGGSCYTDNLTVGPIA